MVAGTDNVRVRVAPSPTGDPHVGLAFTTLFNYLFAKKHRGQMILRIDDTDRERYRPDSEKRIIDYLHWLGLHWDEGANTGTSERLCYQSRRLDIYQRYSRQLLASGDGYYCFCSDQRLKQLRDNQRAAKQTPQYDRHCRWLSSATIEQKLADKEPSVIRLAIPLRGETTFRDELRGDITIANQQLDDQVLIKSDNYPTYHFANVVDDHELAISHVIRAEEWLSSTPKHVVLQRALGVNRPRFIHLPILRNHDQSKISKRKSPVSLAVFAELGILPEALLNYLAHIGGSIDHHQEIFDLDTMIENFNPQQLNLGGPVFDRQKLVWFNQQYLRKLTPEKFLHYMIHRLGKFPSSQEDRFFSQLFELFRPRLEYLGDFWSQARFFFVAKVLDNYSNVVPKGCSVVEIRRGLRLVIEQFEQLADGSCWTPEKIKESLRWSVETSKLKTRELYMTVRLLTTGTKQSPDLVQTLYLLGSNIVIFRLREYLATEDDQ